MFISTKFAPIWIVVATGALPCTGTERKNDNTMKVKCNE